MKKLLILLMMIFLLPAKADMLSDIFNNISQNTSSIEDTEQNCDRGDDNDEFGSDSSGPEHYSWDNLYLCHYCGIEIIIDPYAELESKNDVGFYD